VRRTKEIDAFVLQEVRKRDGETDAKRDINRDSVRSRIML